MIRPWHRWLIFAACLAMVLAVMSWVSWVVLRMEDQERFREREARLGEAARLALWRMDSLAGPLMARETTWPWHLFQAPPIPNSAFWATGSDKVRLHFQIDEADGITSPQAPETANEPIKALHRLLPDGHAAIVARTPPPDSQPAMMFANAQAGFNDANSRSNVFQHQQSMQNTSIPRLPEAVREGPFAALWMGDELLLARQAEVRGQRLVQGSLLDWPALRDWLTSEVEDLLPDARLVPKREGDDPSYLLVSIPARLEPGTPAVQPDQAERSSMRPLLGVAWAGVLAAVAAVAVLLAGTISLSERRAEFVSAVTHELRTPLTTMRLYTEMLTEGMVPGPAHDRYLRTLRNEADRLSHMVENVLAWARLERNGRPSGMQAIKVGELLARCSERLRERAAQAGLNLSVHFEPAIGELSVLGDPGLIEQILLNLVDNACKYGKDASGRENRLTIDLTASPPKLRCAVRDFGPGMSIDQAARLFRPFSKSAEAAAATAPGVGLGLALSRRLARHMGGDIYLDESTRPGARFVLELRIAS